MENLNFEVLKADLSRRIYIYDFDVELVKYKSNPRLIYWLGAISYSGYIRERCLRYLIDNYKPGDENRILLRLEDWVQEIYQLAWEWTKENFNSLSWEQINDNYKVILYLSRKQRLQNSEAIAFINSSLIDKLDKFTPQVFFALNSNLRRYLYLITLPKEQILRSFIIRDKDPNNKLLILKFFKFDELTEEEIATLKSDKSSIVKRRFIYSRLQSNIQLDRTELINLVLDKNKGIREIAAYYLQRDYQIDAYDLYKQKTGKEFYYIADYAKKEDINHFLTGLSQENKAIKLLCLKAICNIDPKYLKQFDLKQLLSENNKFRKILSPYLNSLISFAELESYQDILFAQPRQASIYVNLLAKKSFWHFVDFSLDLLQETPTKDNINFVYKTLTQKSTYTQKLPIDLKTKISLKLNNLKDSSNNKIKLICQEIKFLLKLN